MLDVTRARAWGLLLWTLVGHCSPSCADVRSSRGKDPVQSSVARLSSVKAVLSCVLSRCAACMVHEHGQALFATCAHMELVSPQDAPSTWVQAKMGWIAVTWSARTTCKAPGVTHLGSVRSEAWPTWQTYAYEYENDCNPDAHTCLPEEDLCKKCASVTCQGTDEHSFAEAHAWRPGQLMMHALTVDCVQKGAQDGRLELAPLSLQP